MISKPVAQDELRVTEKAEIGDAVHVARYEALMDIARSRVTTRAFDPDFEVPRAHYDMILEAARHAEDQGLSQQLQAAPAVSRLQREIDGSLRHTLAEQNLKQLVLSQQGEG